MMKELPLWPYVGMPLCRLHTTGNFGRLPGPEVVQMRCLGAHFSQSPRKDWWSWSRSR